MKTKIFIPSLLASLLTLPLATASLAQSDAPSTSTSAAPGSAERPIRVSSGVMQGLLVHKNDPEYPSGTDASGTVVLAAVVSDKGKIVKLDVVSGPEPLRAPSLKAVHKWTYKPYLLNGNAVYVQTAITVMFSR